ncbi:hypothetical protein [Bifidobacterium sp. ESL0732]|uniref:hypothetical protein n=1 Tax=Bifidobacterium sp. ESL0732 TaxID=2983222 RepID=UPI0023F92E5E|nr:hypothetical protein [Bifidobacterium sp. ESL0732]WEV63929.1 hypothetical protein OZX70_08405 [Bifidobacterium sp. ESL0732]
MEQSTSPSSLRTTAHNLGNLLETPMMQFQVFIDGLANQSRWFEAFCICAETKPLVQIFRNPHRQPPFTDSTLRIGRIPIKLQHFLPFDFQLTDRRKTVFLGRQEKNNSDIPIKCTYDEPAMC